jgi:hypothetical protein
VTHVLHLVKDPANAVALDVIRAQAADPELRLSVVLMQEALGLTDALPGQVYRLTSGHTDLPPSPDTRPIGPTELLDLIFAADSVVTW